MANLNKVLIMGNLTRDPELRYLPKGTAVAELGIAVNRRVKINDEWTDETTFIDCTAWGNTAENAAKYLTKGRGVLIEGRLQLDTWEDKQSGQKRSKLKIIAENVQFLPGKGDSTNPNPSRARRQENGAVPAGHTWADDDAQDDIQF